MAATYGYTYETAKSAVNFTNQARVVRGITIHHWGALGSSFNGIRDFLASDNTRNVSAHYVAQGADANGTVSKRVACLVDPDKIAWHAGDWQANVDTIGIECRPEARDADYAVVAELVARLWITYGVVPLYPHKHWVSTACPGKWDIAKLKSAATAKMAALKTGTAVPAPTPTTTAKPTTVVLNTVPDSVGSQQEVDLIATVTPKEALGAVTFEWLNAGKWVPFGTVQAANGLARMTNRPASTVTYRARFIPKDPKAFAGDYSPNVKVVVVDLAALAARVAAIQK
jgi:hypothetical protein